MREGVSILEAVGRHRIVEEGGVRSEGSTSVKTLGFPGSSGNRNLRYFPHTQGWDQPVFPEHEICGGDCISGKEGGLRGGSGV